MPAVLKDDERCAFGLGWEHRRRGLPIHTNPFPREHWKWEDYRCGWLSFVQSKEYNPKK